MDGWQFAMGLVTIVISIFGAAIKVSWRIANAIAELKSDLTAQLINTNNTMLTRIQLAEDNLENRMASIVIRFDARTLEIERDLANFKAYCERQFINRETFNMVMDKHSVERSAMKMELIERLNRIDDKVTGKP